MGYKVSLTPKAAAELAELPAKVLRQVARKIDGLAAEPRPPMSKRLEDATHLYRVRSGDYRVLYQVDDASKNVLVVRVGHRKDVYRRLPPPKK